MSEKLPLILKTTIYRLNFYIPNFLELTHEHLNEVILKKYLCLITTAPLKKFIIKNKP